jgi:hypothetical protein
MNATLVQFPGGGAHPAARCSRRDTRILALIKRHLAAYAAHSRAFHHFDDTDTPEAQAVIDPLGDALCKVEDALADLGERDVYIADWLETIGAVVEDSRYRRDQTA